MSKKGGKIRSLPEKSMSQINSDVQFLKTGKDKSLFLPATSNKKPYKERWPKYLINVSYLNIKRTLLEFEAKLSKHRFRCVRTKTKSRNAITMPHTHTHIVATCTISPTEMMHLLIHDHIVLSYQASFALQDCAISAEEITQYGRNKQTKKTCRLQIENILCEVNKVCGDFL